MWEGVLLVNISISLYHSSSSHQFPIPKLTHSIPAHDPVPYLGLASYIFTCTFKYINLYEGMYLCTYRDVNTFRYTTLYLSIYV